MDRRRTFDAGRIYERPRRTQEAAAIEEGDEVHQGEASREEGEEGRPLAVPTRIAVFIFEGAEELDFVGPWEVLRAWATMFPDDQVEVFTVAPTTEPITCAQGLKVIADHTVDAAPEFDVLVYPGGMGNRNFIGDEAHRSWLQKA